MSKYHYTGFFLGEGEKQKFEEICQACREQFQRKGLIEPIGDPQEPFEKLHSLKEKEIDIKRSRAESIINGTLFALTFLTLVSVLSDMFQLDESLRLVINNFDFRSN